MELTRLDVSVFVYSLGAVISGGLLAWQIGVGSRIPLLVVSALAAGAWTVYFRVAMVPRLVDELLEEDAALSEAAPTVDRETGE